MGIAVFFSFIHAAVNHCSRSSASTWHALSRASAGGAVPFGAVDCGSEEAAAEHLPLQPERDSHRRTHHRGAESRFVRLKVPSELRETPWDTET